MLKLTFHTFGGIKAQKLFVFRPFSAFFWTKVSVLFIYFI